MKKFVTDELIFMTLAGSRMYGTNVEGSDIDKRGVCVPPRIVVYGLARNFSIQEVPGEDTVIYALRKFIQLAMDCNPNIIELLFAPNDCIEVLHPTWEKLREKRQLFLTAKAYHTFTGYAHQQMKRIKGHRGWLLDPPTHQPTREEFGLSEAGQGVRDLAKGIDATEISQEVVVIIEKEKAYKAALTRWQQYQKWKTERNAARAELEAMFGYDCKHAMHLMRLLRMGRQILTEGKLDVRRPDASELLEIRRGGWSYERLVEEADAIKTELDEIYENGNYVVPFGPPQLEISDFCIDLHEYHWSNHAKRLTDE
ncbi:MAG: nucleotidyltransferase domain-containing protein [Nitrospira sp.]